MLSTVLHKHLDEMDKIEAEVKTKVDALIAGLDKKKLYEDPHGALQEVVEEIRIMMEEQFMPLASKNGFELAKEISKKDLLVDPSKDPTKNEEVVQ